MSESDTDYSLKGSEPARVIAEPNIDYAPPMPRSYRPAIALVGCGGIAATHLEAYRKARFNVVALADRQRDKARDLGAKFFPNAAILSTDEVLARPDVEVVDLTPHPQERAPLICQALDAGKHVLSQKPFVVDLPLGRELVERADRANCQLAVNQNGRWAPHFAYIRELIDAGWVGQVTSIRLALRWDHNWTRTLPFNKLRQLILFDFGLHWFDWIASLMDEKPAEAVYASITRTPSQAADPPLLAQVAITYDDAQASILLDADTRHDPCDTTLVIGTEGTIAAAGNPLEADEIRVISHRGRFTAKPRGHWFCEGFQGSMGELLCAIEEQRVPQNNARDNLRSLELCLAAVASADLGRPTRPGDGQHIELPGREG